MSRLRSRLHLDELAEALSDDGALTGGSAPLVGREVRGVTTAIGGLGHRALSDSPFLLAAAVAFVVAVEMTVISWIRMRYMDTPFLQAAFQSSASVARSSSLLASLPEVRDRRHATRYHATSVPQKPPHFVAFTLRRTAT
jgi:hypothetical protein